MWKLGEKAIQFGLLDPWWNRKSPMEKLGMYMFYNGDSDGKEEHQ